MLRNQTGHVQFGRTMVALATAALTALLAFTATASAASPAFTARGSAKQVQVTGAGAGSKLTLVNGKGRAVTTRTVSGLGGVVFRDVTPGTGYRVRQGSVRTAPITVLSDRPAPPSTKIYDQQIPPQGYGYLTTRDGTSLAINTYLPSGKGPFPTLVEYSGYGYARPGGGESSIAQVATLLGYAVVDVNMRGTGCSGGAFDYFEPLQGLDGYDVIETVARQPWVLHHKVGMMGISYGGISQLFVGQNNPPSLVGITPLSVIDNTATTLYPGGILNNGFALSWAKDRVHDAKPASTTGGQSWALKRIQEGDNVCKANQVLHAEAVDLLAKTHANRYYVPKVADPLAPVTFVHKIKKPVFMACQFTDEQTGGHCPTLASRFTGTKRKWFTFTNGTHIDSLDPATFNRWFDFLELYVKRETPRLPAGTKASATVIFNAAMGVPGVTLPDDPIQSEPTYASALKAYEKIPSVRIRFDNGAGGPTVGGPVAGYEHSASRYPLPGTRAQSWYLGGSGLMGATNPRAAAADRFTWNPKALPVTNFVGDTGSGGLWRATPTYRWNQNPAGTALSYVSDRLDSSTTVVGSGALQAWIKASKPSVDLQVTLSEVRPDGKETFVQGGWIRASGRKLDPKKSTLLEPYPSLSRKDSAPLPKGTWAKVTVPLYYEGHAYRKGSRLRVTIAAPGGAQPIWAFDTQPRNTTATVRLAHGSRYPSRLILPVVPGLSVPTALPPCPSLRGEPCRSYQPLANASASLR